MKGAAMARQRRVILGATFLEGVVVEGVDIEGLEFDNCRTRIASAIERRPVFRDIRAHDIVVHHCSIDGSVLERVIVDRFKGNTASSFVNGCELREVTLRGRFREIIIQKALSDSRGADVVALYREALREEPHDGSWSLNIIDAVGEIDIRGYAPRRIRRNPRHQAVITMEQARSGLWRSVDLESSVFQVTIKMMLQAGDWEGAVLAANPASRDFAGQVAAIDELRSIGAIEPD